VVYDFGGGGSARGIELTGVGTTAYLYNNTLVNVTPGVLANSDLDVIHLRNTVALQCDRCVSEFRGTYIGANNRTSDDSAPTLGIGAQLSSDVITDYFVSPSDFHLSAAAPRLAELQDVGADLSSDPDLAFDRDIDAMLRVGLWDVGADEL
jgi:hypothetical protein